MSFRSPHFAAQPASQCRATSWSSGSVRSYLVPLKQATYPRWSRGVTARASAFWECPLFLRGEALHSFLSPRVRTPHHVRHPQFLRPDHSFEQPLRVFKPYDPLLEAGSARLTLDSTCPALRPGAEANKPLFAPAKLNLSLTLFLEWSGPNVKPKPFLLKLAVGFWLSSIIRWAAVEQVSEFF